MFDKLSIFVLMAASFVVTTVSLADNVAPPPAEKCAMTELASLPLTIGEGKIAMPTIPVTVGNSPASFALGLAQPHTAITQAIADANKIQTEPFDRRRVPFAMYLGRLATATATTPLSVGHATIPNTSVLVLTPAKDIDGGLGLDVLSQMDVELNFKAGKVNLFSQNHCAGQAVYWGRSFTTLPMALDEQNVPVFQMQLNGKAVTVKLDPTKGEATMGRDVAEALFGITPDTPGATVRNDIETVSVTRGHQPVPDTKAMQPYDYIFDDLSVNGIEIHHLRVLLNATPFPAACKGVSGHQMMALNPDQCNDGVDLVVGREELRAMRLYFAFGEKLLYVTAADPDPASAGGSTH